MACTSVYLAVCEVLSNVWHLSATTQSAPPLSSPSFLSCSLSSHTLPSPFPSLPLPLPLLPPSVSSPSGLAYTWWAQARLGLRGSVPSGMLKAANLLRLSLRSHPASFPLHLVGHEASANSGKGEIDFISLWPSKGKDWWPSLMHHSKLATPKPDLVLLTKGCGCLSSIIPDVKDEFIVMWIQEM